MASMPAGASCYFYPKENFHQLVTGVSVQPDILMTQKLLLLSMHA